MYKKDKPTGPTPSMINLMQSMQEVGLPSMSGIGTDWMELMTKMGHEMLEFTAARINEDVQTQHDLLEAKDITEVQEIQAQFFQKAMKDYTAESTKLMDMGKAMEAKEKSRDIPV